jgi:hypothetical protein
MDNTRNPEWMETAAQEAWWIAEKKIAAQKTTLRYGRFKKDPVGFGEHVLGNHFTDDVIEVMESVRDNPVTIAKSANAVGKSFAAARIAVWYYIVHEDSKVFATAAPPIENLKHILWGEIMSIAQHRPDIFEGHKYKSLEIYRSKDSFITGVAIPTSGTSSEREGKFSGKHAPHILFIVDEGDAVPDEVYKGIESCMSGGEARLLIMFNPRAQIGPVYRKERNRQANVVKLSAFTHPNVLTGNDIIPGAVNRNITVRRINEWTRPLTYKEEPDASCFEVPQFLVGASAVALDGTDYPPLQEGHRKINMPEFSYMVMGEYPSQSAAQLIDDAWVEAAVARWKLYVAKYGEIPPEGIQPILGVDMAEYGTDYNVACLRYGSFVPKFKFWQGVDPDITTDEAVKFYKEANAKIAMVDGTGVGSSVAPSMSRRGRDFDLRAVSVKVAERPSPIIKSDLGEFKILRDQLWWAMREWLRTDNTAMLPPDPYLIEELKAVEYSVPAGKIMVTGKDVIRERLKRSSDRADALCLTFAPFERARWLRLGDTREQSVNDKPAPRKVAAGHSVNAETRRTEFLNKLEERRRLMSNPDEVEEQEKIPVATWAD